MADHSEDMDLSVDHGPNVKQMTGGESQVIPPELAFFQEPPLMSAIASEDYTDYRPNSSDLNSGSLDYTIPMSSTQLIDLRSSRHHFAFKIVHASDGSDVNPLAEPLMATVNWIGASLWDGIELYLNNQLVTPSGGQHTSYRAMFEALLDISRFKKNNELQSGLWKADTPGRMGPEIQDELENEGFLWRSKWTVGSKECRVTAPITTDLAQQGRLILNSVEMTLKFFRTRPEFHLMVAQPKSQDQVFAPGGYKLHLTDAFLRVKKKTVVPSVLMGIESTLSETPALYPLMRSEVRKYLVHKGQMSFVFENLFQSAIPSVMCLAFVKEQACSGRYDSNPFSFENCQLSNLAVSIDDKNCGQPPMRLYFDPRGSNVNSSYLDGFDSLFQKEDSGLLDSESAAYTSIDRDGFARGYTLFKYIFSASASSKFLPVISRGNLRVEGHFSNSLDHNTTLIIYARFPCLITLDKTRRVTV